MDGDRVSGLFHLRDLSQQATSVGTACVSWRRVARKKSSSLESKDPIRPLTQADLTIS
jgi:hypothetical protein